VRPDTGQETAAPTHEDNAGNLFVPIGPPHRTRGSFGDRALPHALVIGGQTIRTVTIASGAVILIIAGIVIGAIA